LFIVFLFFAASLLNEQKNSKYKLQIAQETTDLGMYIYLCIYDCNTHTFIYPPFHIYMHICVPILMNYMNDDAIVSKQIYTYIYIYIHKTSWSND
jgi:hypothetical protein